MLVSVGSDQDEFVAVSPHKDDQYNFLSNFSHSLSPKNYVSGPFQQHQSPLIVQKKPDLAKIEPIRLNTEPNDILSQQLEVSVVTDKEVVDSKDVKSVEASFVDIQAAEMAGHKKSRLKSLIEGLKMTNIKSKVRMKPRNQQNETKMPPSKKISRKQFLSQKSIDFGNYESESLHISPWDYFCCLIGRSDATKEKMRVLHKGMKDIEERLDIINIMKKFREIDKLKTLLLEDEQLVLFNSIPKAEMFDEDYGSK